MSKTLLLEIGTEEVPAHVMPGILSQLKENAAKTFEGLRLEYKNIRTIGTPRRTALIVEGLAEQQADLSKENRGPAVNIAFDAEGNPTKAAQGFARGQGIKAEDLVTKDGYVYAMVHEVGGRTSDLLGEHQLHHLAVNQQFLQKTHDAQHSGHTFSAAYWSNPEPQYRQHLHEG